MRRGFSPRPLVQFWQVFCGDGLSRSPDTGGKRNANLGVAVNRENKDTRLGASSYESRGASTSKLDVKRAIQGIDEGLFPGAFCKAVPDVLTGSPDHCLLTHADGAGTKAALAYIHYLRHGDPNIFKGIAQDSLVMNLDDLFCVGATGPFVFSNTIGRNSKRIPGEVVTALIHGYEEFADSLRKFGVELVPCGGETADLGDLVRTLIVDSSIVARMRRDEFIDCSRVCPGQAIVGFASFGRCTYEPAENSGIGTNGFTVLRHGIFSSKYREDLSETFAPEIGNLAYTGTREIDDPLPGTDFTLAEACLSPTRSYAPVLVPILAEFRASISAIFHNTGGGQTKCMNFGKDVKYVKDNLFPLPPIFEFARTETGIPLRELLQIFNMGHRLEVVCEDRVAPRIIGIAAEFGLEAQVVGRVEAAPGRSLFIELCGEVNEFRSF